MTDDVLTSPADAGAVEPKYAQLESGSRMGMHPTLRSKLSAVNWLADISGTRDYDLVEVQFKNTRVGFYRNEAGLDLAIGDLVAVEAAPGHDIGRVLMVGRLVALQMAKANLKPGTELKRVFRKARPADIIKYDEARAREHDTMIRSRRIAEDLGLDMKIGDVEYQGDGGKAIFYYIAAERVDFRKLIRILADTFKVRIEMKQIGARQEAGRIGGIGPCGRPLCCSAWMTHFVSVGTSAARHQDLSMNPQKLAGQCAKLKCCLNFEVDAYMECQKKLPQKEVQLETKDATYYFFKADILKREITYSTDRRVPANLTQLSARRAFEIIALNKQGIKPESLIESESASVQPRQDFVDLVGQDSLTRFDNSKKKRRKKNKQRPDAGEGRRVNAPADGPQRPRPQRDNQRPRQQRDDRPQRPPRQQRPPRPNNDAQPRANVPTPNDAPVRKDHSAPRKP